MGAFIVYLSGDDHAALRDMARATGLPMTEHARRAIAVYLASGSTPYQMLTSGQAVGGNVCVIGHYGDPR